MISYASRILYCYHEKWDGRVSSQLWMCGMPCCLTARISLPGLKQRHWDISRKYPAHILTRSWCKHSLNQGYTKAGTADPIISDEEIRMHEPKLTSKAFPFEQNVFLIINRQMIPLEK